MEYEIWMAIIVCAVGTFAMRALPLLWMQRRLAKADGKSNNTLPQWLSILGPLMIAAMCGASLIPVREDWVGILSTCTGITATMLAWVRFKSLGKPVFIGVLSFGLTTVFSLAFVKL